MIRECLPVAPVKVTAAPGTGQWVAQNVDVSNWSSLVGAEQSDPIIAGPGLGNLTFQFHDTRAKLEQLSVNMTQQEFGFRVPVWGPLVDVIYTAPTNPAKVPASILFGVSLSDDGVRAHHAVTTPTSEDHSGNLAPLAAATFFLDAVMYPAVTLLCSGESGVRYTVNAVFSGSLAPAWSFAHTVASEVSTAQAAPHTVKETSLLLPNGGALLQVTATNIDGVFNRGWAVLARNDQ